ncbi:MAG: hypothetical protein VX278_18945, partial [Myxococcota bacterium]|nr:hypothetical protein [Myxococcota bacterium]
CLYRIGTPNFWRFVDKKGENLNMHMFLLLLSLIACSCQGCSPDVKDTSIADTSVDLSDADGDGLTIEEGDCDDNDPLIGIIDEDEDGFSECGLDCDDSDANTHPGAAEEDS